MTVTTGKKISALDLATTAEETDYVSGVDASAGTTARFLMSLIRKARVIVGSTTYGPRSAIKFIAGASATINVTDDSVNDRIDVTIDTTLGPSSVAHKHYLWKTFR